MSTRLNKLYLIVGSKGTGKTFFMINDDPAKGPIGVIHHYLANRQDGKILIIDTIDHPAYAEKKYKIIHERFLPAWQKGIKRIIVDNPMQFQALYLSLKNNFSNGMIIFEDSTKYIPKRKPLAADLNDAIVNLKQKNVDMFFMYHGFRYSHKDIWGYADRLQLFHTPDTPDIREDVINEWDDVLAAYNRIKKDPNEFASESIILN